MPARHEEPTTTTSSLALQPLIALLASHSWTPSMRSSTLELIASLSLPSPLLTVLFSEPLSSSSLSSSSSSSSSSFSLSSMLLSHVDDGGVRSSCSVLANQLIDRWIPDDPSRIERLRQRTAETCESVWESTWIQAWERSMCEGWSASSARRLPPVLSVEDAREAIREWRVESRENSPWIRLATSSGPVSVVSSEYSIPPPPPPPPPPSLSLSTASSRSSPMTEHATETCVVGENGVTESEEEWWMATLDIRAAQTGELSLTRGEYVCVLERPNGLSSWMCQTRHGNRSGLVPSSVLERATAPPSAPSTSPTTSTTVTSSTQNESGSFVRDQSKEEDKSGVAIGEPSSPTSLPRIPSLQLIRGRSASVSARKFLAQPLPDLRSVDVRSLFSPSPSQDDIETLRKERDMLRAQYAELLHEKGMESRESPSSIAGGQLLSPRDEGLESNHRRTSIMSNPMGMDMREGGEVPTSEQYDRRASSVNPTETSVSSNANTDLIHSNSTPLSTVTRSIHRTPLLRDPPTRSAPLPDSFFDDSHVDVSYPSSRRHSGSFDGASLSSSSTGLDGSLDSNPLLLVSTPTETSTNKTSSVRSMMSVHVRAGDRHSSRHVSSESHLPQLCFLVGERLEIISTENCSPDCTYGRNLESGHEGEFPISKIRNGRNGKRMTIEDILHEAEENGSLVSGKKRAPPKSTTSGLKSPRSLATSLSGLHSNRPTFDDLFHRHRFLVASMRGKCSVRQFWLSPDSRSLHWTDSHGRESQKNVLPVLLIERIQRGRSTRAFRECSDLPPKGFGMQDASFEEREHRSFSIITKNNSLDLEAESELVCETWIRALEFLVLNRVAVMSSTGQSERIPSRHPDTRVSTNHPNQSNRSFSPSDLPAMYRPRSAVSTMSSSAVAGQPASLSPRSRNLPASAISTSSSSRFRASVSHLDASKYSTMFSY